METKYAGSRTLETLMRRLEVQTTVIERVVSVSTTPTLLVSNNPRRLLLVLVNHGSFGLRVASSAELAAQYGIVISGNGGSLTLILEEALEAVASSWYGAGISGACVVYVLEVIAQ